MVRLTRERDIEAYLVKRVKAAGGEVRKVKWIGRAGAPDRVVMLPPSLPRIVNGEVKETSETTWVELKAPGEKPTDAQRREHTRMRRMFQHVVVIDSFTDVDYLLS